MVEGGVYSPKGLVGVCGPKLETLTFFLGPKSVIFHTLFQTWAQKLISHYMPVKVIRCPDWYMTAAEQIWPTFAPAAETGYKFVHVDAEESSSY